jgi:hypothetical protein
MNIWTHYRRFNPFFSRNSSVFIQDVNHCGPTTTDNFSENVFPVLCANGFLRRGQILFMRYKIAS